MATVKWRSGPPLLDGRPGYQVRGNDVIKRTAIVGGKPSTLYVLWRDGQPVGWYESAEQAREAANASAD